MSNKLVKLGAIDRINCFQNAIIDGLTFACVSCHTTQYKGSVHEISVSGLRDLLEKFKDESITFEFAFNFNWLDCKFLSTFLMILSTGGSLGMESIRLISYK